MKKIILLSLLTLIPTLSPAEVSKTFYLQTPEETLGTNGTQEERDRMNSIVRISSYSAKTAILRMSRLGNFIFQDSGLISRLTEIEEVSESDISFWLKVSGVPHANGEPGLAVLNSCSFGITVEYVPNPERSNEDTETAEEDYEVSCDSFADILNEFIPWINIDGSYVPPSDRYRRYRMPLFNNLINSLYSLARSVKYEVQRAQSPLPDYFQDYSK